MNLVFIGPQGSGKGTQAQILAQKLSIAHISTGDMFREIKNDDSKLGRIVKGLIDKGKLVPDSVTNQLVKARLAKKDVKKGFILDGYPRDVEQAVFLSRICKIDACVLIHIPDSEAVRRIAARRVCPKCHASFNTIFIKPKKAGVCDQCGSRLVTRDDDKPSFVKERLKKYHERTEPMIKFYKDILMKIDGNRPIPVVAKDILKKVKAIS